MTFQLRSSGIVSNKVYHIGVSDIASNSTRASHSVHARHKGEVLGSIILGRNEETATLRSTQVNRLSLLLLGIDTVDFDNGDIMTFEPDVLACKSTDVDDSEHVRLASLDGDSQVLSIVEESSVWNWLGAGRVGFVDEFGN